MDTSGSANDKLDQVLGELANLRNDNAAVRDENRRLAARVEALDGGRPVGATAAEKTHRELLLPRRGDSCEQAVSDDGDRPGHVSRRGMLKMAGAAAVGAAGASLATAPAAGATTGNMQFGTTNNSGTDHTDLGSSSGAYTLGVENTANAGISPPFAINTNCTNGSGVGASGHVYGLIASGGVAPLLLAPGSGVGPPTSGSHLLGEIFSDRNAALFQCVVAGSPGTWLRVGFNPLNPTRILDTRNSSPVGPNSSINLAVGGHFGVPTQASAVVVNATVTEGTAQSFLTIYPEGTTRPLASNLNWVAGQTIPNLVTAKLGSGGGISIFNAAGSVDVVLDLAGFYS